MTNAIERATEWERDDSETYSHTFDEAWANGPGAYGGIVAAAMLHQMSRQIDAPEQQPRTLELALCAPVHFEETTMEVEIDRRGRSISFASARMHQEDVVCATASATFGQAQEDAPQYADPKPVVAPPAEIEPFPAVELMPRYIEEFVEFRHDLGSLPMSDADEPASGGWLRMKTSDVADNRLIACMLDAWPPSPMTTFESFRPMVTVHLVYHFFAPLETGASAEDVFCLFEAHSEVAEKGYAQEDARLFDDSGTLLATARQLYTLLE